MNGTMKAGSQDELVSSSRVRAPTMSKADYDVIVLGAGARGRVCEGNTGIGSAVALVSQEEYIDEPPPGVYVTS